jgi:hypothetical protein
VKLVGPDRYFLSFNAEKFIVSSSGGKGKFCGFATSRLPKLYIVSVGSQPIYIGVTRQPMRARFRVGFNAKGEGGYHGYAWRHNFTKATLDIWCQQDAPVKKPERDMETVEAEVVFLARRAGQWPAGQTEIHFHPSNKKHRKAAAAIWRTVTTPLTLHLMAKRSKEGKLAPARPRKRLTAR